MNIIITDDYEQMSARAAEIAVRTVTETLQRGFGACHGYNSARTV